jgi:glycosyltransferase involved in cell wall biosynthesis
VRRKIRVLQVIDTLAGGGAERVVVELVRRLDRTRFNLAVCVTRMPSMSASELADLAVPVHVLARTTRFDGFNRLRTIIRDFSPHVLHTHKEGSNTFARVCGLLERVPVIVAHEHGLPVPSKLQRAADCMLSRLGSHVIACSDGVGTKIIERKWIPPARVHVIRNGVDTDAFAHGAEGATVPRLYGRHDGPLIGAISRLDVDKDIGTLLRAVPLTLRSLPSARFVIAGDGPLRFALERQASQLDIQRQVTFLGYQSDVKALLQQIDVFVLSSLREGLPLAVLEAMSMGKPVVATAVGGVPEVVTQGVTGLLVPPNAPDVLASALIKLLGDPVAARAMGHRARIETERHHSISHMVRAIEQLYLELLAGSRMQHLVHASAFQG